MNHSKGPSGGQPGPGGQPGLPGLADSTGLQETAGADESGSFVADEQDLAMLSGQPSRLRASLSKANLVLFGVFLLGVGIVAFMSLRKGPQAVVAADQQTEKQVDSAMEKFLATHSAPTAADTDAPSARADARQLLGDTRRLVEMFFNFTGKKQVPLEHLRTNPFKFEPTAAAVSVDPKTKADKDAEEAVRQKRVEKIKSQFAKLRLQTVINGPAGRQAMIDSSVVGVGDSIGGFRVDAIDARAVKVSCDGLSFILEMAY